NLYSFVGNGPVGWIDPLGLLRGIKPPNQNSTYVCQGGKLVVDLGNRKGQPDEKCSKLHEQTHIRDTTRKYGPTVRNGIPYAKHRRGHRLKTTTGRGKESAPC